MLHESFHILETISSPDMKDIYSLKLSDFDEGVLMFVVRADTISSDIQTHRDRERHMGLTVWLDADSQV